MINPDKNQIENNKLVYPETVIEPLKYLTIVIKANTTDRKETKKPNFKINNNGLFEFDKIISKASFTLFFRL